MITSDHTLLISNPFSLQRPFGYLWFDIFLFNLYITPNRNSTLLMTVMLIAFTYWGWIKMSVAEKCRLLWPYTGFVFNRVETKGGSVLYFSQDKAIPIKYFVSHRPTDPFFWKSKKNKIPESLVKKQYFNLQAHDLVLLTPIVLNYHRYFVFVAFLDIW